MQIRTRLGLRICIGVLYFFSFHRGRPMAAPTHGYVPGLAGMLVRMYGRTEFLETPIRFFLRPSAVSQSSGIPCTNPNKTRKPKYSEPREIQKGQDPFGRFK